MAIFSKRKAADKGKSQATEPEKPKERRVYIPRYAQRDGLIGAPAGQAEEEQEAFKRAYAARLSRENSEMSMRTTMNPKMSPGLSRNSSSMSLDWGMPSSSSRQSNPFASGRSSFQSLPQLMHEEPVPAIPDQYSSRRSSFGAANQNSHSRSSSFGNNQTHLQPSNAYPSRPRGPQARQSSMIAPSPLGRTPETSNDVSPIDSANHSSAVSTASSSSGEVMEIHAKHDSPAQYMIDSTYPSDPRAFGAAPASVQDQTPRKYFTHGSKAGAQVQTAPAPAPAKKGRFSMMMRRNNAVAAH